MPSIHFEYCILGGGIAGLSLADALNARDADVAVVEKNNIASGASSTPLGLVNIATGRRATKTWKAEQCYRAIKENLEKVRSYSEAPFYKNNGVLRPALTAKIAEKMQEQFEKTDWKEDWCRWLTEKEIKSRHPGIRCVNGGIWLPVGMTVDVSSYLSALTGYLESRDVPIYTQMDYTLDRENGGWKLRAGDTALTAEKLIFATGYDALSHPYWQELPLHAIKGQTATFSVEETLSFDHSVSSLGYIARFSDREFVQGSTYEHDFDAVEPDSYGEEYLRDRLRKTLPDLEERATLAGQWAGVRISTPNRKPVLGSHKENPNLYIFNGLGSKGLLFGRFLAGHYAEHLVEGDELFPSVDIERFYDS